MSRRTEKLADLVQSALADMIQRRLKDPALEGSLISLTRVEVAPDLATARVHVSVFGLGLSLGDGGEVDARLREQGVLAALERAEPFLHRELARELYLRRMPRLRFFADHSIGEGNRLTELMHDVAEGEGRSVGDEPTGLEMTCCERGSGVDADLSLTLIVSSPTASSVARTEHIMMLTERRAINLKMRTMNRTAGSTPTHASDRKDMSRSRYLEKFVNGSIFLA